MAQLSARGAHDYSLERERERTCKGVPYFPAEKEATKETHFSLAPSRVLNGNLYGVGGSEQMGKWQPSLKTNQRDAEATSRPLGGLSATGRCVL